jgi:dTDP-4-dehydrorhamnose reductase
VKKILVLGSSGQLGRCILDSKANNHNYVHFSHKDLSISDLQGVRKKILIEKPEYIINCAAYTNVEMAETHSSQAFKVNAESIENLASVSEEIGSTLIHFSTDYVYDGNSKEPYKELDSKNPLNIYGKSKLLADEWIEEICSKFYIFRISSVFSQYGNNFLKTMLNHVADKELNLVTDQFMKPTSARSLAEFLSKNFELESFKSQEYGIYNFSSSKNSLSWFDFAYNIFELSLGYGYIDNYPSLNAIYSNQLESGLKRPLYTVLDNTKLQKVFGYNEPLIEEVLKRDLRVIFNSL